MSVLPAALALLALTAAPTGAAGGEPMTAAVSLPGSLVLETVDGEAFDLASLRGERTLIVTWASW